MAEDPANQGAPTRLSDALGELPLTNEVFLGMQALNLEMVDAYLAEQEAELLREYIETERTPVPSTLFVSAISQMWIFGLYEFLRTWRQRARELMDWADEVGGLEDTAREEIITTKRREIALRSLEAGDGEVRWQAFEKACESGFAEALRAAFDQTERTFRTVEAVRVNLAKHEVPRQRRTYALAPGYGRIDVETGSISWQVEVGGQRGDHRLATGDRRRVPHSSDGQ